MGTNKKTYKEVFDFVANANYYLKLNTDETKLKYAIERIGEKINKVVNLYHQKVKDLQLEHAFADEKGIVPFTIDEQGSRTYEYTKEGIKALDIAIEELFNSEVEVEVYYATEIPENAKPFEEVFKGFVIND